MTSPIIYPYDPTGHAVTNRITDELHTVTEANYRDYFFIIPIAAPFYADGLTIIHNTTNGPVPLRESIDYNVALPFLGATWSLGIPVYGGIVLSNLLTTGTIRLTYQTLGGEWVADAQTVLETLANIVYNPRTTTWDEVTSKPAVFPPTTHNNDFDTIVGQDALVAAIDNLSFTVASNRDQVGIIRHLTNFQNPHQVTKDQIGLPLLGNWGLATVQDALDGIRHDELITPYTLSATLKSLSNTLSGLDLLLRKHIQDLLNPHQVTKDQIGLGNVSNLFLADDSEVLNRDPVPKYITLNQVLLLLSSYNFLQGNLSGYSLTVSTTALTEGDVLTCTINTPALTNGTILYWNVIHSTTSDADFIATSGTTTITSSTGQFDIRTAADLTTEGIESFTAVVRLGSLSGQIVATTPNISLADSGSTTGVVPNITPLYLNAGDIATVNVVTSGIVDNTRFYWTIRNINSVNGNFNAISGSVVITNNQGTFSVSIRSSVIPYNDLKFIVQIRDSSISGPVQAETPIVTIRAKESMIDYYNTCCLFSPRIHVTPVSYFVVPSLIH